MEGLGIRLKTDAVFKTASVCAATIEKWHVPCSVNNQPRKPQGGVIVLPVEEKTIIDAVKKATPSTVNVATISRAEEAAFQPMPRRGVGSGVILTPDGYIVTNNHLVRGAQEIRVTLTDGRKLQASLVGTAAVRDVAVIKLDARDLPAAEFADSDKLQVGQLAIAIGNPFGIKGAPTVTVGVVSALDRTIVSHEVFLEALIQTDAAINPGNSGGALVDSQARVIGINTAVIPYAQGVGFAIPVNTARAFAERIIREGTITAPWLGAYGFELDAAKARALNLPIDKGMLIAHVMRGSPAHHARLRPGDVIRTVDGRAIRSPKELYAFILQANVGDTVSLQVLRRGYTKSVDVTLEAAT
ncbi:MAG: trypsin-like peptidase domain-containing protein [Chloroflexi bacterium]|nr:trypsin-like peptidase domain-containing protein [Chloroflexota bacterium]